LTGHLEHRSFTGPSVQVVRYEAVELDEYEASVNGPASRLLSERTGSLAEAPAPEEKQHAAMAGFGLLLVDRSDVGRARRLHDAISRSTSERSAPRGPPEQPPLDRDRASGLLP
jgi:hypothetical protein